MFLYVLLIMTYMYVFFAQLNLVSILFKLFWQVRSSCGKMCDILKNGRTSERTDGKNAKRFSANCKNKMKSATFIESRGGGVNERFFCILYIHILNRFCYAIAKFLLFQITYVVSVCIKGTLKYSCQYKTGMFHFKGLSLRNCKFCLFVSLFVLEV